MKQNEIFGEFTSLSNDELLLIEGGGFFKQVGEKVGAAWDKLRDCFNGCDCKGCSDDIGLKNTVRFLM